MDMTRGSKF